MPTDAGPDYSPPFQYSQFVVFQWPRDVSFWSTAVSQGSEQFLVSSNVLLRHCGLTVSMELRTSRTPSYVSSTATLVSSVRRLPLVLLSWAGPPRE